MPMKKIKIILYLLIISFHYISFEYLYFSFANDVSTITFNTAPSNEYKSMYVSLKFNEMDSKNVSNEMIQSAIDHDIQFYYNTTVMEEAYIKTIYLYTNDFSWYENHLPFVDYKEIDFTNGMSNEYYTTDMDDENAVSHMYQLYNDNEINTGLVIYPFSSLINLGDTLNGNYVIHYKSIDDFNLFIANLEENCQMTMSDVYEFNESAQEIDGYFSDSFMLTIIYLNALLILVVFITFISFKEREIMILKLQGFSNYKIIYVIFSNIFVNIMFTSFITLSFLILFKIEYFNIISYTFIWEVIKSLFYFSSTIIMVILINIFYTRRISFSKVLKNKNNKANLFWINNILTILVLYTIIPNLTSTIPTAVSSISFFSDYYFVEEYNSKGFIQSPSYGSENYFYTDSPVTEAETGELTILGEEWNDRNSFYFTFSSANEETDFNDLPNSNYITTSKNYFIENPIYEIDGALFTPMDEDIYYVLVPQNLLEENFFRRYSIEDIIKFNFNVNAKVEFITIKNNQQSLNYDMWGDVVYLKNYYYIVIPEDKKSQQNRNIYFDLYEGENVSDVMSILYEKLNIHIPIYNAFTLIDYNKMIIIRKEKLLREMIFQILTCIFILTILLFQQVQLYCDIYKKRISIQTMMGMEIIDKYKDILCISIFKYITLILMFIIENSLTHSMYGIIICIIILDFIILYTNIISFERKNIIPILKGED